MEIIYGGLEYNLPKIIRVEQIFKEHKIKNIENHIEKQLYSNKNRKKIKKNMRIGLCVGSRGISEITRILKKVISELKKMGAHPFIIPSMGSHGDACSLGQKNILKTYGITEKKMGVPIISSLDVVKLKGKFMKEDIFFDKIAYKADGIIPINRIKCHTDFRGNVESGLCKMLVIGLGNHQGASQVHSLGYDKFDTAIPGIANIIINNVNILFGIAILEDANNNVAELDVVLPENFIYQEGILLKKSKNIMAKINIKKIDVLVIKEMGKDISGTGMDPNIIGRFRGRSRKINDISAPKVKIIIVHDLTANSMGNAEGVGYADIITRDLYNKIDLKTTYTNICVGKDDYILHEAKIPMIIDSEKDSIALGAKITNRKNILNSRIVLIKNTLNLNKIYVSNNIYDEIKNKDNFSIDEDENFKNMEFDNKGRINNLTW